MPVSVTRPLSAPIPIWLWLALILAAGLTLASKHSGIVFVAGAFGWIFVAALIRGRLARFAADDAKLVLAAAADLSLFVALSPALWNNPPARVGDLLRRGRRCWTFRSRRSARAAAVDPARRGDPHPAVPDAAAALRSRLLGRTSRRSPTTSTATWRRPSAACSSALILGGALTLLAGVGVIVALRGCGPAGCAGLLAWLLVTVASLIANPLALAALLSAADPGGDAAGAARSARAADPARRFVLKSEQPRQLSPVLPQTD